MSIYVILLLAVGLSMDAFSLALIYGTLNIPKIIQKKMSIIVGIFHFFMPILGYQVGELILRFIKVKPDILVGIIFILLSLQMIMSLKEEEKVKMLTNLFSIILFAFTVSIDSFSIGISFGVANINLLLPCIIFSLASFFFTYIGVSLGTKLSEKLGSISTLFGGIILLILGVNYLL